MEETQFVAWLDNTLPLLTLLLMMVLLCDIFGEVSEEKPEPMPKTFKGITAVAYVIVIAIDSYLIDCWVWPIVVLIIHLLFYSFFFGIRTIQRMTATFSELNAGSVRKHGLLARCGLWILIALIAIVLTPIFMILAPIGWARTAVHEYRFNRQLKKMRFWER